MNHESHYHTRPGTWDLQTTTGNRLIVALKKNRRGGADACCSCTVKRITKKSSLQMWVGGLSISKMIEFMHGHPRKPANWCQGSNELIILVWRGVSYDSVSFHFCEKDVKTAARNYQQDILTNVVEPLNQIMFQNRSWIFQ